MEHWYRIPTLVERLLTMLVLGGNVLVYGRLLGAGGTWSQSTNIILKLTPDSNGWTLSDHWQCARMQFGPINTPTFKSVSISFAYVSGQNNIKVPYLAWGSENSLNQYSPVKRSNTYGRYSLYSGGVGKSSSGQETVSHNIHNYTVNGDTTWYQWFDIKLYCELPYDATSNAVTVHITKITLNKSTV